MEKPVFTERIDLAAAEIGGLTVAASDDFFAAQDNLLKPEAPVFIEGKYTSRGKWMDGWESRRRRLPADGGADAGFDWCVVRLGLQGTVHGVDIDTRHFLGNHPPYAALDGLHHPARLTYRDRLEDLPWFTLVPHHPLERGSHNFLAASPSVAGPVTHVRLRILPDGGVARLRVYGVVAPDFAQRLAGETFDLAAIENGGVVVTANDTFFGPKDRLIIPGRGLTMGDGWETRRKRIAGHDWVVVRLGTAGLLSRLIVDTCHFKGNYPDRCSADGLYAPGLRQDDEISQLSKLTRWEPLLGETPLEGHKIHEFGGLRNRGPFTHVRLNIFPDGGVSRLRVLGTLT